MLAKEKIPVIISDDAHNSSQLGNHFKEAQELISLYGLKVPLIQSKEYNAIDLSENIER